MKDLTTVKQIITELEKEADPAYVEFKKNKFNIVGNNALGVSQQKLNNLAKRIPKDDGLALELFATGIYECRLLCSKVYKPADLTIPLMNEWASTFENWEMCDSFSLAQFCKGPSELAIDRINGWSSVDQEFIKRASFATIAGYTRADKKAPNKVFESFFPLITAASTDDRVYIKKAVDWALRNIGKRNIDLQKKAISVAKQLMQSEDKTAQWIGKTSLKELESDNVSIVNYPRDRYPINRAK